MRRTATCIAGSGKAGVPSRASLAKLPSRETTVVAERPCPGGASRVRLPAGGRRRILFAHRTFRRLSSIPGACLARRMPGCPIPLTGLPSVLAGQTSPRRPTAGLVRTSWPAYASGCAIERIRRLLDSGGRETKREPFPSLLLFSPAPSRPACTRAPSRRACVPVIERLVGERRLLPRD